MVIVGEIMEVSEAASNVTYKIDDRTGPRIDVKRWMDEQVRRKVERVYWDLHIDKSAPFANIFTFFPQSVNTK